MLFGRLRCHSAVLSCGLRTAAIRRHFLGVHPLKTATDMTKFQSQSSQHLEISTMAPFTMPVLARWGQQQQLVKITHIGNVEGMSTYCFVVNEAGQCSWVSLTELTIVDPTYLPSNLTLPSSNASRQ